MRFGRVRSRVPVGQIASVSRESSNFLLRLADQPLAVQLSSVLADLLSCAVQPSRPLGLWN